MNSISNIAMAKLGPAGPGSTCPSVKVVQALVLSKENLWEFLKSEAVMDRAVEILDRALRESLDEVSRSKTT